MAFQNYTEPSFELEAFHCPFCKAYSHHIWGDAYHGYNENPYGNDNWVNLIEKCAISRCMHCDQSAFWVNKKIVYPSKMPSFCAHEDMPDDIKKDFEEARSIFDKSPRGSAALLRLCIQKLMIFLGEKGKNINEDIACLVEKGLSPKIQRALDYCRVVGNNAVHPAELNIDDTPEIAELLFKMINFIVEEMISKPKEIDAVYALLPQKAREAIEKRDSKTNGEKT